MISPDQHQNGVSYFLQRGYLPHPQNGLQLQSAFIPQRFVTHQGQHFQLQPHYPTQIPMSLQQFSTATTSSQIIQSQQIQQYQQHQLALQLAHHQHHHQQQQHQQQPLPQLESPQLPKQTFTPTHSPQLPNVNQQRQQQQQHQQQQQQQQQSVRSPVSSVQQPSTQASATIVLDQTQSINQTNAKIKSITEKCIGHYIDGQLILETTKPLTEKKLKSAKKKKQLQNIKVLQKQSNNISTSSNKKELGLATPKGTSFKVDNTHQQRLTTPTLNPANSIRIDPSPAIQGTSSLAQPESVPATLPPLHTTTNIVGKSKSTLPKKVAQAKQQARPQQNSLQSTKSQPNKQVINLNSNNNNDNTNNNFSNSIAPNNEPTTNNHTTTNNYSINNNNHSSTSNRCTTLPEDIHKTRAEMANWSVADVAKFIERHEDIRQYSYKFAEDEVDGKALLLMIDRNLNLQILRSMFSKHGPAMKVEAALSRYKID